MSESPLTIREILAKGKENLKKAGFEWVYPAGRKIGPTVKANRAYLDSLFFEPNFLGSNPIAGSKCFDLRSIK